MKKIVLITNIPAPYRVDLFYYMQTHIKEYEIHVIYTNENEDNRSWNIPKEKMLNSHVLHSKVLRRKGMLIYYSLFWIICGIRALIKKTKFGKALFIFVISSLFLALTGESIIDYSIVLLGILMGMCLKVEEYMN